MKKYISIFFLLLSVFLIFSLIRASGVSAAIAACASPVNGSTINPNNVTFTWTGVPGAPGYHFRLERNDPWAEVIIRNDIPGTSFIGSEGRNAGADLGSPINLTAGKSYHWRVWPSNASEAAAGSACDFTVATSPAAPTAVITANPSTVTSGQSTTLTWSSTNAVKCILNPPGVYKTVDPSGSDSFSPTTTTTYNIRCEGVGGAANSVTTSTTVNVTTPVRRDLCVSTTVIPGEGHVTIPSTSNEANLKAFRYAFYNRDNGTKIICQQGITSVADDAETKRQCPNGGAPLVFDIQATADTTRSDAKTMSANFSFTELSKQDTNWNNQIPTHFQVNGYFIDQNGMSSLANTNCSKSFDIAVPVTVASVTFNNQSLDLNGGILSTRLALPSGATSVDVPIDVIDSSGSTRHLIIKFNYLSPPTNPSASCPAPGTTANFSWNGVSGATRYDLYVHNTADPALTWGSGGNACTPPNSCEPLTTTSKSLSARIPGATYQWFVFACNSSGCSSEAGGSFSCGASSPTPPRPIPGDADDNSCVSNVDLAQWTKEVKGDCHRCSAWTPGTTPPARKFAEDYSIWYDAFKAAKTLCGPAPASNCTTNVCQ